MSIFHELLAALLLPAPVNHQRTGVHQSALSSEGSSHTEEARVSSSLAHALTQWGDLSSGHTPESHRPVTRTNTHTRHWCQQPLGSRLVIKLMSWDSPISAFFFILRSTQREYYTWILLHCTCCCSWQICCKLFPFNFLSRHPHQSGKHSFPPSSLLAPPPPCAASLRPCCCRCCCFLTQWGPLQVQVHWCWTAQVHKRWWPFILSFDPFCNTLHPPAPREEMLALVLFAPREEIDCDSRYHQICSLTYLVV